MGREYFMQDSILDESDGTESRDLDGLGEIYGLALMPCEGEMRVPDNGLKAAVYLGYGTSPEDFRPVGTGFFVDRRLKGRPRSYYLLTADHVARKLRKGQFAIRLNDYRGKAQIQQSEKYYEWWNHPTDKSVDAAVFPWGLQGDFTTFPVDRFITEDNLKLTNVGVGDEVFIIGLFQRVAGKNRVIPIVRHGHIAMMAEEPILTANYGDSLVHLVEAVALKGLSGAPVFVRETIPVPLARNASTEMKKGLILGDMYLLGLVHGYFTVGELPNEPRQRWHSGVSMVVPSTMILEILNQPQLLEFEMNIEQILKEDREPPVEANVQESSDQEITPKGYNIPKITREKFFKDLSKATRRKRPTS
jgi:hypothetical protein